jgi:hypothetical protein
MSASEKRQDARERAAGDPLQLLAQHAARSAEIAGKEDSRGHQEIHTEIEQLDRVQKFAAADRRKEIEGGGGNRDVQRKQRQRNAIQTD